MYQVLTTRLLGNHGLSNEKTTLQLIEFIKLEKPNIILLHNIHGYYLNIDVLFRYLANCSFTIYWTFHDCWPMTGHCAYFDRIECEKWLSECSHCPQLREYPSTLFFDNTKRNYYIKRELFNGLTNLNIITPSNWLKQIVTKSYLKNYESLNTINNGVDTSLFSIRKSSITNLSNFSLVVLGVASPWTKRKGLDDFIKLSSLLQEDEIIVLVGIKPSVARIIRDKRIIPVSKTECIDDLVDYYNSASVLFNPTYEDNFPTTNLEALSCGTPVITYNTGGSPEAIDEYTGFSVEKGDFNGAYEKMKIIKSFGKLHYAKKCRDRALKRFNKIDRYGDYFDLFNHSLKETTNFR